MKAFLQVLLFIIVLTYIIAVNFESKPSNDIKTEEKISPVYGLTQTWGVPENDEPVTYLNNLTSKNFYVIFDGSGSMEESKCADGSTKADIAKKALTHFAQNIREEAMLGLYIFDAQGMGEKLPLGTNNRNEFIQAISTVNPGGGTPLQSALIDGVKALQSQAIHQRGYGDYNLVVVTDGEASDNEDPAKVVEHLFAYTPVVVHTIGFCIGKNHSLNQPGKTLYDAAQNEEELVRGLEDVLAEAETFDLLDFDKK